MALNATFTQVLGRRPDAVHGDRRATPPSASSWSSTTRSRGCGARGTSLEEASHGPRRRRLADVPLRDLPAAAHGAGGRARCSRSRCRSTRSSSRRSRRARSRRCRSGSSPTTRGPNQLPIVNVVGLLVILLSIIPVYLANRLSQDPVGTRAGTAPAGGAAAARRGSSGERRH